jgi:hypothetical protein
MLRGGRKGATSGQVPLKSKIIYYWVININPINIKSLLYVINPTTGQKYKYKYKS